VESLGGPLVDRHADRARARDAVLEMWQAAARHPAVTRRPQLAEYLGELRQRGLLTRAANGNPGELLTQTLGVIDRLPANGMQRSVLAAELTGDAHALDDERPLSALVLRGAARLAGWPSVPTSSVARRRLWADVGVACDPLSADVLVFALRPKGDHRLARHLRESAADGEPRRVTLRELLAAELSVDAGAPIFVCENPGVVAAAADRLGAQAHALVCVDGNPTSAALHLLRQARACDAMVRVHADFDWAGVRIANRLIGQLDAAPWRFGANDYRVAAAALTETIALDGGFVQATWDPELATTMRSVGRAVFEEQLLAHLLADLAASGAASTC
jgi:uncharacterized protein (TIGR02679 family)